MCPDRQTLAGAERPSTAYGESREAKALKKKFDAYSLTAITPDLVAEDRDERPAAGKPADTVRLDPAAVGASGAATRTPRPLITRKIMHWMRVFHGDLLS